jgi:hypothetical protein
MAAVGVALGCSVAVGDGMEVAEGARAAAWVTWASTVAATCVRKGSRSMVGVADGVGEPQATHQREHIINPMILKAFFECVICAFLLYVRFIDDRRKANIFFMK